MSAMASLLLRASASSVWQAMSIWGRLGISMIIPVTLAVKGDKSVGAAAAAAFVACVEAEIYLSSRLM